MSTALSRTAIGITPGVIPPLITPLTSSGDVDQSALARHIDRLVANGVTGLFILGSSGEGPWLTGAQRETVIATAVRAAAGQAPVIAGVLDPGPAAVIENARRAADAGANAIVVTTPYYFAATHETQLRHFGSIADSSSIPVVLYNISEMTHNRIEPETARALATHPNIIGLKDSDGNQAAFERFLAIRENHPDFVVFQGHERSAGQALLAGADGIVPGLGNLAPMLLVEMARCAAEGDRERVEMLQKRINRLWALHTEGIWLVCLKYACSLHGIGSGTTAGHADDLSLASREAIAQLIANEGMLEATH